MGNKFAVSEIVELGIQIEKNGRDFYNTVAEHSRDKKVKDMFLFLAEEEQKHISDFRKVLDAVNEYQPTESYPRQYFAYMNALAGEYVFTEENKGKEIAEKTKSDKEAVELSMRFEKESILFYEGMKSMLGEGEHSIINELIRQEQNHLQRLIDLKRNL